MYFDNDYVRVLTVHSHSQLLSLLAEHGPSRHILLHLSCSACATCNSLDNDLASLSLQYPADCLFLRCNIATLTETAQWANVDPTDPHSDQPIVRVLPLGARGQDQMDVVAAHAPLGTTSHQVETRRIVDEVKSLLVNKLGAVHFNDWSGDASTNLIENRIQTHHLLHDHDEHRSHERDQAENNNSPIPFDQMPAAMAALLTSPITSSTAHPPDSGRASAEELSHDDDHEHDHDHDGHDACSGNSDQDNDPYEADDDEDVCPCCHDRLAAQSQPLSASSSRSSMSRSRTRSASASSSSVPRIRARMGHPSEFLHDDEDANEDICNDIDNVVAIGQSGSIPTSPLVGRIRHQLPATAIQHDGGDPLETYVDRLEAIKRGDELPADSSESSGVRAALGRFFLDNAVSLLSLMFLVVALALTLRVEIVPATGAKLGW